MDAILMDAILSDALSRVCSGCHIQGACCQEARPPLTANRIKLLLAAGVSPVAIEFDGYSRLRLKPDGSCVMCQEGQCDIHRIKPETCLAAPFTFDVKGPLLEIYLKRESICPMAKFLRENEEAYRGLFDAAVENITSLVRALPPSELAVICKIEEPETDLVAKIALEEKQDTCK
jgi:Fe-S-cluster containining protein